MNLIKNKIIKDLLSIEGNFKLSDNYYKKTIIRSFGEDIINKVIPQSWIKINFKTYPRLNKIILPKPKKINGDIKDLLISRRSRRIFSNKCLKLDSLSSLLFYSAGIINKVDDWTDSLRTYPSGGGRYPLELYLVINNVDKINNGLYHYNVKDHSLELLLNKNLSNKMGNLTGQKFVKKASIVLIMTGIFDRTRIKYEERGFRYVLMECGHLCQNIYLVSESLGLSCCSIGGFMDIKINELLDIQYTSEKVLYLAAIGNTKNENK